MCWIRSGAGLRWVRATRRASRRYVYLFADGLYLKAGIEKEKSAVLVAIGVDSEGCKALLAMELGYRESSASWAEVLRGLRDRGLATAALLGVGDGGFGFWAGLSEVFPRLTTSAAGTTGRSTSSTRCPSGCTARRGRRCMP